VLSRENRVAVTIQTLPALNSLPAEPARDEFTLSFVGTLSVMARKCLQMFTRGWDGTAANQNANERVLRGDDCMKNRRNSFIAVLVAVILPNLLTDIAGDEPPQMGCQMKKVSYPVEYGAFPEILASNPETTQQLTDVEPSRNAYLLGW
jgi:hypothetical protein